jgi:hypothetical protein
MAIGTKRLIACLLTACLILLPCADGVSAQARPRQVALELVLAMDTSSSVDASEFELQRQGMVAAFRHPDVVEAIERCGGEDIAVATVQWSGNRMHVVAVDWTLVRDRSTAAAFAARIAATTRLLTGFTGLGGAIRFSLRMIEENHLDGRRRAIDISGDGSSSGLRPDLERDRAVGRGATINGLAILNEEPDLDEYYAAHVIGGPGAFAMSVESFDGFAEAFRAKLLREIRCPSIADSSVPDGG